MITKTVCKPYDNITILHKKEFEYEYSLKEMARVIDRNNIKDITCDFFTY